MEGPGRRRESSSRRRAAAGRRRIGFRTALKLAAIIVGSWAMVGVIVVVGLLVWAEQGLPNVQELRHYDPPQATRILGKNGAVVAELFVERRTVVPLSRIPRTLIQAVLAAEDADFYRHEGLDYGGMARALLANLRRGRVAQGGSTITQQVVKNLLTGSERTMERKLKELVLARRLEQFLSKDEILFLYLNHINFGDGRYGVEEAARYYFGKSVSDLTLGECAILAAIPKSPSHYNPRANPAAAAERRLYVLREMVKNGFVDERTAAAAAAELVTPPPPSRAEDLAPELSEEVRRILHDAVGDRAARGGFTVETTIDPRLQLEARRALRDGLRALDKRQGWQGPLGGRRHGGQKLEPFAGRPRIGRIYVGEVVAVDDAQRGFTVRVGEVTGRVSMRDAARYNVRDDVASRFAHVGDRVRVSLVEDPPAGGGPARLHLETGPEGALVCIEPRTRAVVALVGGYDVHALGFNRALYARRQPGSAFKPMVYGVALTSRRYTPASIVEDAPVVLDQWHLRDTDGAEYRGPMRLRPALAQSINAVAVRLILDVSPQAVVNFAHTLGIRSELEPTPALALGASSVTPIDLANAFAVFAAGGIWQEPILITRIVAPDGHEVPLPARSPERQVLRPEEAYLMTSMLTSVVEEGTGQGARRVGRPAAGKTGTSNDARDAWFVGYTSDLLAGVWVGFDDRAPLGTGEQGARSAVPVWADFARAALGRRPVTPFPVPTSGVVTARIDPESGLLATNETTDAIEEIFLDGTAPVETARPPGVVDPSRFPPSPTPPLPIQETPPAIAAPPPPAPPPPTSTSPLTIPPPPPPNPYDPAQP